MLILPTFPRFIKTQLPIKADESENYSKVHDLDPGLDDLPCAPVNQVLWIPWLPRPRPKRILYKQKHMSLSTELVVMLVEGMKVIQPRYTYAGIAIWISNFMETS